MNRKTRISIAAIFGTVFITVILVIAIAIPNPSAFQYQVFRITLALAAGGAGAMIPGILHVNFSNFVSASGALAVFVIVYFYSPANLAVQIAENAYRAPDSVYVQQLENARRAFEGTIDGYKVGLETLPDVISAHRQYVKVQLAAITDAQGHIDAQSRINILKNALNTSKNIESMIKKNLQDGREIPTTLPIITEYRIEREIELSKAQSTSNK